MIAILPASPASQVSAGRQVRSVDLKGPAGKLEAVWNEGAPNATFAVLVCHPHPSGGGTLHNKVVYHAMKALNAPQWGIRAHVLRFNFRGTGKSQGVHDGVGEKDDVLAALDWLRLEFRLPMVLVGFSFGAVMSLAACADAEPDVRAIAALGLPTHAAGRTYRYSFLKDIKIPKLFLSGDADQFAPSYELERVVDESADPKKLVLLPGADHFFTGQLPQMQETLAAWLQEQVL